MLVKRLLRAAVVLPRKKETPDLLHKFFEEGYWFAPKKLGYGSGWPIAWQGWALLAVHLAIVMGIALWMDDGSEEEFMIGCAAIVLLTFPFLLIVKRRTKGGWRRQG